MTRAGLIGAVTGGVLLLVAAGVTVVFPLQTTVLDRAAVERDVATQFEKREGVGLHLDCADDMTVEDGATYRCTGVTDRGEQVTLRLAVTDAHSAAYTWAAI